MSPLPMRTWWTKLSEKLRIKVFLIQTELVCSDGPLAACAHVPPLVRSCSSSLHWILCCFDRDDGSVLWFAIQSCFCVPATVTCNLYIYQNCLNGFSIGIVYFFSVVSCEHVTRSQVASSIMQVLCSKSSRQPITSTWLCQSMAGGFAAFTMLWTSFLCSFQCFRAALSVIQHPQFESLHLWGNQWP